MMITFFDAQMLSTPSNWFALLQRCSRRFPKILITFLIHHCLVVIVRTLKILSRHRNTDMLRNFLKLKNLEISKILLMDGASAQTARKYIDILKGNFPGSYWKN